MIFASDLDQTLIYSKRFLSEEVQQEIQLVETKVNQEISYMTEIAVDRLKRIADEILFVPVTTRTVEQYKRISLFKEEILPKYAIVSNGGNLIVNGEVDPAWNDEIHRKMQHEGLSLPEVISAFQEIQSEDWVLNQRISDDLFAYSIVNRDRIPVDELSSFEKWLHENNWGLSLQGRKLYFVPQCVSKWKAIAHIMEREELQLVVAAGDSLLDFPMLKEADYALCPCHGEIYQSFEDSMLKAHTIQVTEKSGIFAAEEILKRVAEFIKGGKNETTDEI